MRSNGEGKPVVALDIDGTLGDYHANFLRFAALYFGVEEPGENWKPETPNPGQPLWVHMDITERDYRDAKLAYRQGGWKRWMPCYSGASELTQRIRSAGAEVWLCTTRPYLRLDNVDPDTREWLRRNGIEYDAVLFDPLHPSDGTKYHELARQAGKRVASVTDDLPEMIEAALDALTRAEAHWVCPILREQPYNGTFRFDRRVADMEELGDSITADISAWRTWGYGS